MFDPDKYDRTPYHWWPEHARFFVNPAVGGLGLLVIVASLDYFVVAQNLYALTFPALGHDEEGCVTTLHTDLPVGTVRIERV